MARFHITGAIAWSVGGTVLSGFTGPIVALLVAKRFSPEMQGYYYTFSSLLAMSVLLELGFNGCIVQFISHEYAHLRMDKDRLSQESPRVLGRLASLVRLSLKWYLVAGLFLLIGVGAAGELFFRHNLTAEVVLWRGPWWCLCALSAMSLVMLPLGGLLDGCDQVSWTARARIVQNATRSLVLIVGLDQGLGLYAPAVAALFGTASYAYQFSRRWLGLLRQLLNYPIEEAVSWQKEILPMQWRIAVSWASGYFIFSIFGPLIFAYAGAAEAGRFGMTWTFLMAINGVAQSFVVTRGPKIAALTAKKEWSELKRLWIVATSQATGVCLAGVIVLSIGMLALRYFGSHLGDRLIGIPEILILGVATILNQIVFSVAVLARAEKREPFLVASVVVAFVVGISSYFSVREYGVGGISASYLAGTTIALICSVYIYQNIQRARR